MRRDKLDDLFKTDKPRYCILTAAEWKARPAPVLLSLVDEQGAPIVLTRIEAQGRLDANGAPKIALDIRTYFWHTPSLHTKHCLTSRLGPAERERRPRRRDAWNLADPFEGERVGSEKFRGGP